MFHCVDGQPVQYCIWGWWHSRKECLYWWIYDRLKCLMPNTLHESIFKDLCIFNMIFNVTVCNGYWFGNEACVWSCHLLEPLGLSVYQLSDIVFTQLILFWTMFGLVQVLGKLVTSVKVFSQGYHCFHLFHFVAYSVCSMWGTEVWLLVEYVNVTFQLNWVASRFLCPN